MPPGQNDYQLTESQFQIFIPISVFLSHTSFSPCVKLSHSTHSFTLVYMIIFYIAVFFFAIFNIIFILYKTTQAEKPQGSAKRCLPPHGEMPHGPWSLPPTPFSRGALGRQTPAGLLGTRHWVQGNQDRALGWGESQGITSQLPAPQPLYRQRTGLFGAGAVCFINSSSKRTKRFDPTTASTEQVYEAYLSSLLQTHTYREKTHRISLQELNSAPFQTSYLGQPSDRKALWWWHLKSGIDDLA